MFNENQVPGPRRETEKGGERERTWARSNDARINCVNLFRSPERRARGSSSSLLSLSLAFFSRFLSLLPYLLSLSLIESYFALLSNFALPAILSFSRRDGASDRVARDATK